MTFEAGIFQPDILLSAQYLAILSRNSHSEPEKKLLLAVLEDAIDCFQRYFLARDGGGGKLFHEAEDWILEENSDWPFSFDNICELLGFDPKYLRRELLRWKYEKLAQNMVRRRVGKTVLNVLIASSAERERCCKRNNATSELIAREVARELKRRSSKREQENNEKYCRAAHFRTIIVVSCREEEGTKSRV